MREIGTLLMQAMEIARHTSSEVGVIVIVQRTSQLMERLQLKHAESVLCVGIMCRPGPL